ncbi:MAG: hypothetical protein K1X91_05015 [Bacteriodetes bacterium]|nr:hypothetical protein [Bacteroidota bacterium]
MTKHFIAFFCLTILACSCNNQPTKNKVISKNKPIGQDTTIFKGLHGTWFRQNKYGFTLIEIKDTSNVLYYQVSDRQADFDNIKSDRFWYYKSKAIMGYSDKNAIWISTDKFRFDYKLKGDTLIEFDKMGDQGIFIKVYTDEQKAYKIFNDATFKGEITHVVKVDSSEYFVLNNIDNEFSFTSIPNKNSDSKQFTDVAAIGDMVIKSQFGDTLTLIKKQTNKSYKFGFVQQ